MGLPPAIQRQLDEAERLQQQMLGDTSTETATKPETPPQDAEPVPDVPEVKEGQPKPEEPAQGKDKEVQEWQQKFATLQGKYNAEVPRLHQQLHQTNQALQGLKAELDSLRKQPEKPTAPTVDTDLELIREHQGDDIAGAMQRLLQKQMAPLLDHIKQLETQLQQSGQQVNQIRERQTLTDEQRFWQELGQTVPDYQAVNADPGFLAWLGEVDPFTGVQRQALLDHAGQNFDVRRVGAIFNAYKATQTKAAPNPKADELAKQVAPGKSKASSTDTKAAPKWTQAKVEEFYQRDYAKLYLRNPTEADRLDREIKAAMERGEVG